MEGGLLELRKLGIEKQLWEASRKEIDHPNSDITYNHNHKSSADFDTSSLWWMLPWAVVYTNCFSFRFSIYFLFTHNTQISVSFWVNNWDGIVLRMQVQFFYVSNSFIDLWIICIYRAFSVISNGMLLNSLLLILRNKEDEEYVIRPLHGRWNLDKEGAGSNWFLSIFGYYATYMCNWY